MFVRSDMRSPKVKTFSGWERFTTTSFEAGDVVSYNPQRVIAQVDEQVNHWMEEQANHDGEILSVVSTPVVTPLAILPRVAILVFTYTVQVFYKSE